MINEDVRAIVEAELQPGEELLWADRPARIPFLIRPLIYLLGGLFGVFVFVAICSVILTAPDAAEFHRLNPNFAKQASFILIIILFGVPPILIGNFVHFYWSFKRQIYALTSERLVVLKRGLFKDIRSFTSKEIYTIKILKKKPHSHLKLMKNATPAMWSEGQGSAGDLFFKYDKLFHVPSAETVANFIHQSLDLRGPLS